MKRLLGFASFFFVTKAGFDLVVLTFKAPPIICSRGQFQLVAFLKITNKA